MIIIYHKKPDTSRNKQEGICWKSSIPCKYESSYHEMWSSKWLKWNIIVFLFSNKYELESWTLMGADISALKVFERKIIRKIYGFVKDEERDKWSVKGKEYDLLKARRIGQPVGWLDVWGRGYRECITVGEWREFLS